MMKKQFMNLASQLSQLSSGKIIGNVRMSGKDIRFRKRVVMSEWKSLEKKLGRKVCKEEALAGTSAWKTY